MLFAHLISFSSGCYLESVVHIVSLVEKWCYKCFLNLLFGSLSDDFSANLHFGWAVPILVQIYSEENYYFGIHLVIYKLWSELCLRIRVFSSMHSLFERSLDFSHFVQ